MFASLTTRLVAVFAAAVAAAAAVVVAACRTSGSAARRPARGSNRFIPAAARSAGSTDAGQPGGSGARPSSTRLRQPAQRTAPSPFAVTARPDPEATGAVIRRIRLGWHRAGQDWRYDDVSRDQWEIICRDCGDDEGAPPQQTADVRLLRRPVVGLARAQAALQHHLDTHRQTGPRHDISRAETTRYGSA